MPSYGFLTYGIDSYGTPDVGGSGGTSGGSSLTSIPGATNQVRNPSFETNTTDWAAQGSGASIAQTGAEAWVGSHACRVTCNGSVTNQGLNYGRQIVAATVGQNWSIQIRATAVTGSPSVFLRIREYNASGTYLTGNGRDDVAVVLTAGTWTRFADTYTTTSASCAFLSFDLLTSSAQNVVFDVDGAMAALEDSPSSYVDGDQGPLYSWTGTPHASSSVRQSATTQKAVGRGGLIKLTPQVFRADRLGNLYDELTPELIDGAVVFDDTSGSADVKTVFKANFRDPTVVTAYVDFLAPFLTLTYADGSTIASQCGLFVVVPTRTTYTDATTQAEVEGRSMEWLLAIDDYPNGYTVAAGTDYVAAVRTILTNVGLTRFNLPLAGKVLPTTKTWDVGTKKLTVVNDLLAGCAHYPIHTRLDGSLASYAIPDLTAVSASLSLVSGTPGSPGNVVDTLLLEPDWSVFRNRVTLVLDDPSRAPLVATAVNNNPASPGSILALGFTAGETVKLQQIPDQTTLQAYANALLQRAAGANNRYTVAAVPDPRRNPYEIVFLDVGQIDGTSVALGNYFGVGYTIPFTPTGGSYSSNSGAMSVVVQRIDALV